MYTVEQSWHILVHINLHNGETSVKRVRCNICWSSCVRAKSLQRRATSKHSWVSFSWLRTFSYGSSTQTLVKAHGSPTWLSTTGDSWHEVSLYSSSTWWCSGSKFGEVIQCPPSIRSRFQSLSSWAFCASRSWRWQPHKKMILQVGSRTVRKKMAVFFSNATSWSWSLERQGESRS